MSRIKELENTISVFKIKVEKKNLNMQWYKEQIERLEKELKNLQSNPQLPHGMKLDGTRTP